ncbi:phage major capsid protein [Bacteroides sp.]|uniref:phage major capsid family protein n=1 Tax=Bacteroides sp. TaxID=29523 RepID=UPI00261FEE22|nr:phage major capsid protein [Bacteroides sp.]MDD3039562.1 phage major capsid protein [Bacteroides sp.]
MSSIEDLKEMTMAAGDEISHADGANRIPEVWGEEIEVRANIERILRRYVRVNTDLVGRPGDTVKLPKKTYSDMDTYAAAATGGDLVTISPNFELTLDLVTIEPVEVALATAITKQIIDEAMISVLDEARNNMADTIADKEDQDILAALVATSATEAECVTYVEAKRNSVTFVSGKWTTAQAALAQENITSVDVLDLSVIVEASEVVMHEQGFVADVLFIHPRQKASLLRDDNFIDAAKNGGTVARQKGVIGEIFGLEVVTTRRVPSITISGSATGYQAILMDKSAAAVLAIKRPVTIETEYKPAERKHYLYFTQMYKAQRVNHGAVVLINTA